MDEFMATIVVTVSKVCTYFKLTKLCMLNRCTFFYANHTSVKWFKQREIISWTIQRMDGAKDSYNNDII